MRNNPTKRIERFRVKAGIMGSDESMGANGLFAVPFNGVELRVIVSDATTWESSGLSGEPWEHVSVSLKGRCPTWEEMDYVKRVFWRDNEVVMQLHVAREDHINCHPYCLHLWRPCESKIPTPPPRTVGI